MKIIFLGTPEFAAFSLQKIHQEGNNIVAVITAPDRKAGRGQQLQSSAVKKYAVDHGIDCLQPKNLKDPNFLEELRSYQADLQIVVAFRMLPEVVWNMPPLGTMNLHASLLPAYRGAAPINWAIINGEKKTGVTTFFLKHEIDTGEVLLQKEVEITSNDTAGSLHDKLMAEGAELILKSIELVESGDYRTVSQENMVPADRKLAELPKAPKIFREDCKIDWNKSSEQIDHFIRGLSPYPAAWTQLKRKKDQQLLNLKIYKVKVSDQGRKVKAGALLKHPSTIEISSKDGSLLINELQLEGKRRMSSEEFLNGTNLEDYEELTF